MNAIGKYLFSVAGASLISGILLGVLKDNSHKALMKLICGIFLLLCVIRPLADVTLIPISPFAVPYREAAADVSSAGKEYARAQLSARIKQETEAYILDKAAQLGAEIRVEVGLSEDPLPRPVSVQIRGNIAPYSKQKLQAILSQELGIAKENQIWTG